MGGKWAEHKDNGIQGETDGDDGDYERKISIHILTLLCNKKGKRFVPIFRHIYIFDVVLEYTFFFLAVVFSSLVLIALCSVQLPADDHMDKTQAKRFCHGKIYFRCVDSFGTSPMFD